MSSSPITIKDIAAALNLSIATVSRALKDSYMIGAETKARVKAYAAEHHYRPNLSAQRLKNKGTRSIGVSLASIHNTFYADVLNGIEHVAAEKEYCVIISQCHESSEKESRNLEHLMWRGVDGLLISMSSETDNLSPIQEIISQGVPIVFFDRVPQDLIGHAVVSDNEGGSFQITKHLAEKGYKRIAHLTSNPSLSIARERCNGYRKALSEAGLKSPENYIEYCMHGGMMMDEIDAALSRLLSLPKPPDAIFTASDRITVGCLSLLQEKGISVPGQMAVAGFSNFSSPQLFNPPLTTVSQQAFEMGKRATALLIQQIESKHPLTQFEKVILPTCIDIRSSS